MVRGELNNKQNLSKQNEAHLKEMLKKSFCELIMVIEFIKNR